MNLEEILNVKDKFLTLLNRMLEVILKIKDIEKVSDEQAIQELTKD